jgi:hypothetical protein
MEWQPIETAPENTDILCWSSYNDSDPFHVDRFRWVTEIETEVESETRNAKGRRRIIQEREERKREWHRHYGAEYWMPLPAPPAPR